MVYGSILDVLAMVAMGTIMGMVVDDFNYFLVSFSMYSNDKADKSRISRTISLKIILLSMERNIIYAKN